MIFQNLERLSKKNLGECMFADKTFCRQISEVIDIEYFELKYLKVFVDRMFVIICQNMACIQIHQQ
jgi:chorismate-pyruvate lyase